MSEATAVIQVPRESFSRRDERDVPAVIGGAVTPMHMLHLAVQQGADIEKMKQLMELQERWEANEARKAFNESFSAFKAEAVQIIKNKGVDAGPLAGKKYAELFSVVNAVTPALSRNGLSASWKLTKDEREWIEVTCTLRHSLGHFDSVSMGGPPDAGGAKSAIQARASTITYLERYTLKAVCGVAEQGDDKDGGGGGKGMEEAAIADHLAAIESAADEASLKTIFAKAYRAAQEAKDQTSERTFIKAKDARRKALGSAK